VTADRQERASAALAGTRLSSLRWVEETGSTNRDLMEAIAAGAPDATVLVADRQTAGRGRRDRTWVTPARAALCSVLLRPARPSVVLPCVSLATGVAAVEAVARLGGAAGLKWPNDVMAADRKLAGILAEAAGDAAVTGIGVNLALGDDAPPGIPIGLDEVTGGPVDEVELVVALVGALFRWIADVEESGPAGLMAAYRGHCTTLGREVAVELPGDERLVGRAADLAEDGRLVVVDGSGARRLLSVGDVVHLR
jgi:BirA family transcriptional regulator, biotin operon repressor / biotin---[acetyl-CoA-carboxylase] ligase